MKVLFVSGIFPPDIGGPATYTDEMATELQSRGHDVSVITLSDTSTRADSERPFEVTRIRRHQNFLQRSAEILTEVKRRDEWADAIFAQGLQLELGLAARIFDTPLIARVVGDKAWEVSYQREWAKVPFEQFQNQRFGPRSELLRLVRRWALQRMDAIVAATDYFARQIERWGVSQENIYRINNFVQRPDELPGIGPLPGDSNKTIVTVGRLVEWKRIDVLIDAIARLSDVNLIVVGDGPEREQWEQHARERGVDNRVFFVGQKPHPETLAHIRSSDAFALPSTWESFSIVVLEAMAVETPVVVSDIGGPNEIVTHEHDGLLVPPEDSDALTEAINRIIQDSELAEQLTTNANDTLETYSLSSIASEVESLFDEEIA